MLRTSFLLLFLVLSITSYTQTWEFIGGPRGVDLTGFTIGPNGNFYMFSNGAYRSTDEGLSWRRSNVALPLEPDSPLKMKWHKNGTLYLATPDGLLKSSNTGELWENVCAKNTQHRFDVVVSVQGTIVFLSEDSLFISDDEGTSWSAMRPAEQMTGVYTDSVGMFYVTSRNKSYRSTDQGKYWMRLLNGFPSEVSDMAFTPDGKVFAFTRDYIYVSTDTGTTWSTKGSIKSTSGNAKVSMYGNTTIFIMGELGDIQRSTDLGKSWTEILDHDKLALGGWGWNNIVSYKDRIYYFTRYELQSRSDEGDDLRVQFLPNGYVQDLLAAPSGKLYALTTNGQGWTYANSTWNPISEFQSVTAMVVDSTSALLGMTSIKFLRVEDGGSFSSSVAGIGSTTSGLAVNKSDGVFAVTSSEGFFRSIYDGGKTWAQLNIGMSDTKLSSISVGDDDLLFAGGTMRYYRSTDAGMSWQEPIFPFISGSGMIRSMARSGSLLAFGIDRTGAYFSSDMGLNWENHSSGLALDTIYDLVFTSDRTLLAATSSGIYRFSPIPDTWSKLNMEGIDGPILSLTEGKDGKLYVGTEGVGVFRSTKPFSDVAEERANSGITVYPNPASTEISIYYKSDKPEKFKTTIYNLLGEQLLTTVNQDVIAVSSLSVGQYFLRIYTDGKIQTLPLSIVR